MKYVPVSTKFHFNNQAFVYCKNKKWWPFYIAEGRLDMWDLTQIFVIREIDFYHVQSKYLSALVVLSSPKQETAHTCSLGLFLKGSRLPIEEEVQ